MRASPACPETTSETQKNPSAPTPQSRSPLTIAAKSSTWVELTRLGCVKGCYVSGSSRERTVGIPQHAGDLWLSCSNHNAFGYLDVCVPCLRIATYIDQEYYSEHSGGGENSRNLQK